MRVEAEMFSSDSLPPGIMPARSWTAVFHSHFTKTNPESPLAFANRSRDCFAQYAYDAYISARAAGVDIWAVTDYNFDAVRWARAVAVGDGTTTDCTGIWERNIRNKAKACTESGRFLALAGFEYGNSINYLDLPEQDKNRYCNRKNYKGHVDAFGDIVIFGAPFIAPRDGAHDIMNPKSLEDVYAHICAYKSAVGIFAHPAPYPDGKGDGFQGFRLYPDAVEQMVGCEVYNGCSMVVKQRRFVNEYLHALLQGWRVGAMYNPDTAWPCWGVPSYEGTPLGYTMVLDYDNTRGHPLCEAYVMQLLHQRRFYGTTSPSMVLGAGTENGYKMGDIVEVSDDVTLYFGAKGVPSGTVRLYWGRVGDDRCHSLDLVNDGDPKLAVHVCQMSCGPLAFVLAEYQTQVGQPIAHTSPIWLRFS